MTNAAALPGHILLFATKGAMLKQVPGEEFETNNRMVAATKLADGDQVADIQMMDGARGGSPDGSWRLSPVCCGGDTRSEEKCQGSQRN